MTASGYAVVTGSPPTELTFYFRRLVASTRNFSLRARLLRLRKGANLKRIASNQFNPVMEPAGLHSLH
jgi:hypothetical protein